MRMKSIGAATALLALASLSAAAQSLNPDGDQAPPQREVTPTDPLSDYSFGAGTQDYVVQAHGCHERAATPRWIFWSFQYFGNDTAAGGNHGCPVDLPHGARVTGMECALHDASAAGDVQVSLQQSRIDVTTGAPLGSLSLAAVGTTGATGYQFVSTTLATPVTLRRRNGNERNIYWLFITLPADVAANASFRDCAILWNRQVSAAPATATFTDVPIGHGQRPFVEALAAAGITGGCAPGLYCPDASLTRGQMAVFLAAALGLHFPN